MGGTADSPNDVKQCDGGFYCPTGSTSGSENDPWVSYHFLIDNLITTVDSFIKLIHFGWSLQILFSNRPQMSMEWRTIGQSGSQSEWTHAWKVLH